MTLDPREARAARTHRPPRRRRGRSLALLLGAALLFGAGVAVGQALDDNPGPGRTESRVRTLRPLPLPPAALETVTVTRPAP